MLSVTGDDVVAFKHGEKSAQTLSSAGFRNLTFRTYHGYVSINFLVLLFCISDKKLQKMWDLAQCRLGHYTIPEEMDVVCNWLTAILGLDGLRLVDN